jgi:hypothetical protein
MQLTLLAQCSGILVSGKAAVCGEGNSSHLIALEFKKGKSLQYFETVVASASSSNRLYGGESSSECLLNTDREGADCDYQKKIREGGVRVRLGRGYRFGKGKRLDGKFSRRQQLSIDG